MAAALEFPTHTGYQYYEDRYKREHLPPELYSKVRGVLMARDIAEPDIRQLLDADIRRQIEGLDRRLTRIESLLGEIAVRAGDRDEPERPATRRTKPN